MTHSIQLPRGVVIASLSSIYMLGFIVTPYSMLYKSTREVIFSLVLVTGVGLTWSFLSANSFQIELRWKDVGISLLLLAGMSVLNYRPLNSVIPFRGDETSHIERTLALISRISFVPSLVMIVLFVAFILAGMKGQKWGFLVGVTIVICILIYFFSKNSFEEIILTTPAFFLRWPFISYWFFAVVPKLASSISSPYHEVLYRVIPFLSMVGIARVVQKKLEAIGLPGSLWWGFAIATVPLIFYYSSILYIEPPAVLFMTIACLDLNNLLHKDSNAILQVPSWYALLLIGFIKETTIPFLLGFIAIRTIVQLRIWSKTVLREGSERTLLNLLMGELRVAFSLLAPLALYLCFRVALISTREYTLHLSNLFDPTIYPVLIQSFFEQFGLFLFFFIGGCIVLLRNRDFILLSSYLSLIIFVFAFYTMDIKVYVGYSRFNLFVLPSILAGSIWFITWVSKQQKYVASMLIVIAIGSNLLLSPVHLDGIKTVYWGNYLTDTSEHYYPYQDALLWLKNNYARKRMLFTDLDFYYPFQFYWNKLDWKPRRDGIPPERNSDETLAVSSILMRAEREHYSIVVYPVLGKDILLPREMGEFRVQAIKNSAHTILIFYTP